MGHTCHHYRKSLCNFPLLSPDLPCPSSPCSVCASLVAQRAPEAGGPRQSKVKKTGDSGMVLLLYLPSRCLHSAAIAMDKKSWMQACETANNRPWPQRIEANIISGSVAVRCALAGRRATMSLLLSGFIIRNCRFAQRDMLRPAAQAAAVAAAWLGGGGRPLVE